MYKALSPAGRTSSSLLASSSFGRSALVLGALVLLSAAAHAQPTFTKVFEPSTIGPGSLSTLRFEIDNPNAVPSGEIAFTDNLPAGLSIATPGSASTDCGPLVALSAPDGGTTISLTDGTLGPGETCFVVVNVVSSATPAPGVPVTHMNVSGILSSTIGSAGPATADLVVTADQPGFTKSFSPNPISPGQVTTLTLTLDNTANTSGVAPLRIDDVLPTGMLVASPSRASTDCGNALLPPTLTAISGTSTISFFANGALPTFPALEAGESCTITVDVTVENPGRFINTTSLVVAATDVGKASAALDVPLDFLTKSFVDDPVPPGGTVTLEFTITNFDRNFSATGIAFTDDLDSVLSGLVAVDLPKSDVCGEGSLLDGAGILSFTGGELPPMGTCTFSAELQVPAAATPGEYPNATTAITATIDGMPVTGNMATDRLRVEPSPTLTKEFLDDPIRPGDSVELEFTVTNTSPTDSAFDVAFEDVFDTVIRTASVPPPAECCGPGSSCTFVPIFSPSPPCSPCDAIPARLSVTGGTLEPAGMAGDSCTFSVTLDVAADAASGIYPNATTDVTATVDGETVVGQGAADDLVIVAAPSLSKSFTPDTVAPGGTATLEFTLELSPNSPADALDVTFTDDLNAALTGLVATLPSSPDPPCGAGSTLTGSVGDTFLTLEGGTLVPGDSCTFSVDVTVPAATASGIYTNTTSQVDAMVDGQAVISAPADADLTIADVRFTKEFLGDPVIAGESLTLRFTIDNLSATNSADSLFFTDSLSSILPGTPDITAAQPATANTCGGTLSGTSTLIYSGGSVAPSSSCVIDVTVVVPASAPDGSFGNVTSSLSTSVGTFAPALDAIVIDSTRLQLVKTFTGDPVAAGDPVTLEFVLTNLDAARAASGIEFIDVLNAALSGLTFDSILLDDCGGTVIGLGTSIIDVSAVALAAEASCTLRVSLGVPEDAAPGTYLNTTSEVTGTMAGLTVVGTAATDELQVLRLLGFTKSFDGPTVAGGTAVLTFTLTNPSDLAASGLAFSDNLEVTLSGLTATSLPSAPCGEGSSITGTSQLLFNGGELDGLGDCSFDVEVTVPPGASAGEYLNTTSELFEFGLAVSDPATGILEIEPPPLFDKTFVPDVTGVGVPVTLVFDIVNSSSVLAATGLDFTDNLPADLLVAMPPNASTTCAGGTLGAVAGTGVITYTGGTVAAGASCAVQVDVVASATGFFNNTAGPLTSSSGSSGTAHDTLAVDPAPGFHKSFSPHQIAIDGVSTLTFTINNGFASVAATGLDFTDNLPASVIVATPANASTTCTGGTLTAADGATVITYTAGSVAAGADCTVEVDVTSSTVGVHENISGELTSSLGSSGTASAKLTVNPPPLFSKSFAPNPSIIGGVVTLTFVIDNSASTASANDLAFTDTLPAGLQVADPANPVNGCSGGTLSAPVGSGTISYSGGSVSSSSSCTLSVDVTATAAGDLLNATGELTSTLGTSDPAEATLRVNPPPIFAKAFQPPEILLGDVSTLVFEINNSKSTAAATDLDFTDTLPAEIVIADPANAGTDCEGGILTADAGTDLIAYTGGIVAEKSTCTVSVDVTSDVLGMHLNTSSELTSSLGTSDPAEATLTVQDLDPPVVTAVATVAAGPLEACDTVQVPFRRILVTIEDDRTPILGADASASYLLAGTGPDGDFSTVDCAGGIAGDDVAVAVQSVTVTGEDPLLVNATLIVADEDGLPAGLYRFFVCDTITDTAGNPLDGDGDMTGGGDFEISSLRADPFNLFVNGHFDDCPVTLDPWAASSTPPSTVQEGVPGLDDFVGSPLSASARVVQSDFPASRLSQCVAVAENEPYDLEYRVRYEAPMGGLGIVAWTCEFYDAAACAGALIDEQSVADALEDEGGAWLFSEELVVTPAGAVSALCTVETGPIGSDPFFDLYLDGLFLGSGDLFQIFLDGFESGDTTAWSSASP